jgi:hypothetical protein
MKNNRFPKTAPKRRNFGKHNVSGKNKNKKISTFVSCYSHLNKKFNEIK